MSAQVRAGKQIFIKLPEQLLDLENSATENRKKTN